MANNDLHTPFGVLPLKETVEFIKNLTFVFTLQSVGMVLGNPHAGVDPALHWMIIAGLLAIVCGISMALVIELYLRNWENLSRRMTWLIWALLMAIGYAAAQAVKLRLEEGW